VKKIKRTAGLNGAKCHPVGNAPGVILDLLGTKKECKSTARKSLIPIK
jgi:hypothetical protein